MSFKAFVELERQGLRVEVEDVDVLVLAAGGQLEAVGGETAVPHLWKIAKLKILHKFEMRKISFLRLIFPYLHSDQ